jgi:hypothetical protein
VGISLPKLTNFSIFCVAMAAPPNFLVIGAGILWTGWE